MVQFFEQSVSYMLDGYRGSVSRPLIDTGWLVVATV